MHVFLACQEKSCHTAGESYPLEEVHAAVAASQRLGHGAKVFLRG